MTTRKKKAQKPVKYWSCLECTGEGWVQYGRREKLSGVLERVSEVHTAGSPWCRNAGMSCELKLVPK